MLANMVLLVLVTALFASLLVNPGLALHIVYITFFYVFPLHSWFSLWWGQKTSALLSLFSWPFCFTHIPMILPTVKSILYFKELSVFDMVVSERITNSKHSFLQLFSLTQSLGIQLTTSKTIWCCRLNTRRSTLRLLFWLQMRREVGFDALSLTLSLKFHECYLVYRTLAFSKWQITYFWLMLSSNTHLNSVP